MSHSAGKNPSKQDDGPIMPDTSNGKHKDGEPEQQSRKESRTKVQELTEDDVYAFQPLKGRLSSSLWRFVPFLPPNAVKQMKSNENDEEHGTPNTRVWRRGLASSVSFKTKSGEFDIKRDTVQSY